MEMMCGKLIIDEKLSELKKDLIECGRYFVYPEDIKSGTQERSVLETLNTTNWEFYEDKNNLKLLEYYDDKYCNEESLMRVLAKYARDGSCIEMVDYDTIKQWEWTFVDGKLYREDACMEYNGRTYEVAEEQKLWTMFA